MKLKLDIEFEVLSWSLKLNFEVEVWSCSLKLKSEVEVWSWSLKLKFEVEVRNLKLKKFEVEEIWSWRNLKLKEIWSWRNLKFKYGSWGSKHKDKQLYVWQENLILTKKYNSGWSACWTEKLRIIEMGAPLINWHHECIGWVPNLFGRSTN